MFQRVLVYGVTGSGKTTLAAQISLRTGLPWQEGDALTWELGWNSVPLEIQRQRIDELCSQDRWILDTAYATWLDLPLARCELIVALDYPRWLSLWRLVRRSVVASITHRPMCNGNYESWGHLLNVDSIVVWHFRSFSRKRARIREWDRNSPGPQIIRLTSPAATKRWLASLPAPASAN